MGAAASLLDKAGIPAALPSGEPDPGLLRFGGDETGAAVPAFIDALAKHRHFERETDPPVVSPRACSDRALELCRRARDHHEGGAGLNLPTEPIGSIPRPDAFMEAVATYGPDDPKVAPLYKEAVRDTVINSRRRDRP